MQKQWLFLPALLAVLLTACPDAGNTPDKTAPTIISSQPANNAIDIAVDTNLKFVFSEAMKTTTVTLSASPNVDLGTGVWNTSRTELEFKPPVGLSSDTSYTLTLVGQDDAGNNLSGVTNLGFKTLKAPDTTAPTITSSQPMDGDRNVALNTNINLVFSKAMKTNSVVLVSNPNVDLGTGVWNTARTAVEYNPPAELSANTIFYITVTGQDDAGNPLAGTKIIGFITGKTPDTTAPTITANYPLNKDTNVPINTNISFDFSEAMNPNSVVITTRPEIDLGTGVWNTDHTQVEYNPPSDLSLETVYTLIVVGQDTAGNAFDRGSVATVFKTTKAPDTTPPTVLSSVPANGATEVPLNNMLMTVTFSEPMNAETLKATASVTCRHPIPNCTVILLNVIRRQNSVELNVAKSFLTEATYKITVTGSDLAGNPLAATTLEFTTVKDNTPPTVVNLLPANGSRGVARDTSMSVSFSEAMNYDSLAAGIKVTANAANVSVSIAQQPSTNTYTIQPSTPLPYGSSVSLSVNSSAKDLSGNSVVAETTSAFNIVFLESNVPVYVIGSMDGWVQKRCQFGGCSLNAANSAKDVIVGHSTTNIGQSKVTLTYRGFVGFDLFEIKNLNPTKIVSAYLSVGNIGNVGNPFAVLGDLLIQRVNYGVDLTTAAYNTPVLGCGTLSACVISTNTAPERDNLVNVLPLVTQDFIDGHTSQFRLQFTNEVETSNDFLRYSAYENAPDNFLYWPILYLTFEHP
jgi:methionine-rich copper-binding protein CopC